ncbi:MAG TPA: GNAT family N-acetyltransferase [Candidatus Limnocylindrales bacterium]|nr:GNAT family N-acetyltransferase [Candidatus Limnocylindrales bacterium]
MRTDAELIAALDHAGEVLLTEMCERVPGARVERPDGLILAIGAVPSPVIVNTIETTRSGVGIAAIDAALARYEAEGKHPSIMSRDHADLPLEPQLEAAGWHLEISLPGMVVESRLPERAPAEGVTFHRVETERDRERFVTACLAGFAGDDDAFREGVSSAFSTLESLVGDPVTGYYAMVDGQAAACALSCTDLDAGMGVVGWVGTDPAFRRRGLGSAVTVLATNACFDLGATAVGLQASPMGFPIYQALGYRTFTGYKVWFRP